MTRRDCLPRGTDCRTAVPRGLPAPRDGLPRKSINQSMTKSSSTKSKRAHPKTEKITKSRTVNISKGGCHVGQNLVKRKKFAAVSAF